MSQEKREMDSVYIKVATKDRLPLESGFYLTNNGHVHFLSGWKRFIGCEPQWWLEEVEVPSEKNLTTKVLFHNNTMYNDNNMQEACNNGIKMCYNYILNKLKGENK